MAKKRVKPVSFDAMVKFFMLTYDIPSRKDFQKIMAKLESLEMLIKNSSTKGGRLSANSGSGMTNWNKSVKTAFETVFGVIKSYERGAGFDEIQEKTGFNEKKIRNIIFRLNKLGKIKRKSRGIYIAV
ncbi:hypothetical protein [Desulfobacterium sp. N47]|uniref:Replication protein A C-terminal domain-containing protein n=1 Tax=uncultured Desulfobacterium sp. TaxID=201089 RepID=E1YFF2_9BACT|nr:hypothetical protein N47_J02770 [uncultured Desulfobacterium sp.]